MAPGKEIRTMTTPQTTTGDNTATGTNGGNGAFPADVVAFAAAQQVEPCLQPLWAAIQRIFPTARWVKVRIDDDPEIRDERHILFEVKIPDLSLEGARRGRKAWIEELFRVCPAPLVCVFRLSLDLGP
jgi:hypothetical protein